jgi:hypothetical protein
MNPHHHLPIPGAKQLLTTFFTFTLAFGSGCTDDSKDEVGDSGDRGTSTSGEDTDDPPPELCKDSCRDCEALKKDAYACNPRDENDESVEFQCIVCEDDPSDANNNCASAATAAILSYAYMGDPNLIACSHLAARTCAGWDPNAAVTEYRDGTAFDVDADFVKQIIADPSQLADCDLARVERRHDVYQIVNASDGDFLYEIGLRSGDVIRSINGYAMTGPSAAIVAFYHLWPQISSTSISIEVSRPAVGAVSIIIDVV